MEKALQLNGSRGREHHVREKNELEVVDAAVDEEEQRQGWG